MTDAANQKTPLLFRYPGGKHYAIKLLRPFWEAADHDEYREPFVGGGSVFFNKPLSRNTWLNDIDSELVTTMRMIANPKSRESLLGRFANEVANPVRWREVYESVAVNDEDVAFKYFYLNRTSFSGKLVSPSWGYREKRSLPPERWSERVIPCGNKLEGVKLTSVDFEALITAPSQGKVLMFVDPPYFKPSKKKHYRHGFLGDDHVRLAEALRATPHKFFLTYEDTPEIREMYSWANLYPVDFVYRVGDSVTQGGGRHRGFELVITNYLVEGFESV